MYVEIIITASGKLIQGHTVHKRAINDYNTELNFCVQKKGRQNRHFLLHRPVVRHLTTEPIFLSHSITWHSKKKHTLKLMVNVSLLLLTHSTMFNDSHLFTHNKKSPIKRNWQRTNRNQMNKGMQKNRFNILLFSFTASTKSSFNQLKRVLFKSSAIKSHHHENYWQVDRCCFIRADIGRQNKRNWFFSFRSDGRNFSFRQF